MKSRRIISLSLLMSGLLFLKPHLLKAQSTDSGRGQVSTISEIDSIIEYTPGQNKAYDVYQELLEASITLKARSHTSPGGDSNITYGAEKEASSFLITKVMGPNKSELLFSFELESERFKREFIKRFVSGKSRNRSVVDINGVNHTLRFENIRHLSHGVDRLRGEQLNQRLEKLIEVMGESPYSHLTELERKELFKGKAPHQQRSIGGSYYHGYTSWVPILGKPQKYIGNSHGTGVGGWEINFKPMPTYGEFEEMIRWFKESLKNAGKLFQAPGHQRIVFPKPSFEHLPEAQERAARELWTEKTSEMFRSIQAYIIARGIAGGTGIERGNYKVPHHDANLRIGGSFTSMWGGGSSDNGRGPIRYDSPDRFVPDTLSVELRAGTKDASVQQFIEQVATARLATNQLGDLGSLSGYELYPKRLRDLIYESYRLNPSSIEKLSQIIHQRFGVSELTAQKFIMNSASNINGPRSGHIMNIGYNIPLWNWENAPYMRGKSQLLQNETVRYIELVATTADPKVIQDALKTWTKNVRVNAALENYLRPKAIVENMAELAKVRSTGRVNVNTIDLGIEYSGRFTNAYSTEMTPQRGIDGQQIWLNTTDGMTPHERKQAVKRMALALGKALNNGRAVPVIDASTVGAHGHGLSIAFKFRDKQGRSWRAEWDGVGRNYTQNGEVISESMRGGHIEIVTPKFNPTYEEMRAVYTAMEKEGVIPSLRAGGGHINIDLAPFAGKPRQLARFLSLFHEHRGIIAFMFQNINRGAAAEAVEISENLRRQLRDFRGTETQLKQLLYNERYFNQRVGRKTRNMQIDMSAYFQDVIPARHIHQDFDMKNPTDPWREQFRVDSRIRKMEMRLFDAPLDVFESSMQIKLVRALMNQALNETGSIRGTVQEVSHLEYANNYERAEADMKKMCEALGLNYKEYKMFLSRAAVQARQASSGRFFRSYEDKIGLYGWKKSTTGWGEALRQQRPSSRAVESEGRHWSGTESQISREFRELRVEAARHADNVRQNHKPSAQTRPALQMSVNCRKVFGL